jgi:hypothetical protein
MNASHGLRLRLAAAAAVVSIACPPVMAQESHRTYVGGLFGVSTLQADGRGVVNGDEAGLSLYKPENGLALNLFAGRHLAPYFTVQANWMWNRNDVALVSSLTTPQRGVFYEQQRGTSQMAVVADALIYFRGLDSRLRPYLGTGLSVLWFASDTIERSSAHGLSPPEGDLHSTRAGLRSHVGIDIQLSRRVSFRYSFSETISSNPISPWLTPPGERRLANFQNLFGVLARF